MVLSEMKTGTEFSLHSIEQHLFEKLGNIYGELEKMHVFLRKQHEFYNTLNSKKKEN